MGPGHRCRRARLGVPARPAGGDRRLPRTWEDLLAAAEARRNQERARVANPLIPIDSLMSFCSICAAAGEPPYAAPDQVVSRSTGRQALGMLKALQTASHPASLSRNPPRMLDLMSTTDEIAYIPLLFGYSNYARPGFRPALIRFSGVPTVDGGASRGHPRRRRSGCLCQHQAPRTRGGLRRVRGQPGHPARDLLPLGDSQDTAPPGATRRSTPRPRTSSRTPWPHSTVPISARDTWASWRSRSAPAS